MLELSEETNKRISKIFKNKFCKCGEPAKRLTGKPKEKTLFWCQDCYLQYTGQPETGKLSKSQEKILTQEVKIYRLSEDLPKEAKETLFRD